MSDLRALKPKIEARLQELMEANEWTPHDRGGFGTDWKKGDITIQTYVDAIYPYQGSRYVTGYWVVIACSVKRRFKVNIIEGNLTAGSFSIDEKKLTKKIEELCAMLEERKSVYDKEQDDTTAFCYTISRLLKSQNVRPSHSTMAIARIRDIRVVVRDEGDGNLSCEFSRVIIPQNKLKELFDHIYELAQEDDS